MKVTNNTANPLHLAGVTLGAGETADVPEYDSVKDSYPVQQFLKGEAISVAKASKPAAGDADERAALFAELDKLKVTYDKKATTPALLVVLEDAKKKASAA